MTLSSSSDVAAGCRKGALLRVIWIILLRNSVR